MTATPFGEIPGTSPLAPDYPTARARFLAGSAAAGAAVEHHRIDGTGPSGEDLVVDVAVLGPGDAPNRVFVVSGTHGIEGFAGSLCQSRWLEGLVAGD